MKCGTCTFKFKGIQYAYATQFIAVDKFYEAWEGKIAYGTPIFFSENDEKLKILICYAPTIEGRHILVYVKHENIKEIVVPKYWGVLTKRNIQLLEEQAKEKETGNIGPLTAKTIQYEKKTESIKADIEENFNAWSIYILIMSLATIFKANVFLWVVITLYFAIYKTYEHK